MISSITDISYTYVGKHHSEQQLFHKATGESKLVCDTSKHSVRVCSPNIPKWRICDPSKAGIVQPPCITDFSKGLRIAFEEVLLPVFISSDGKSKAGTQEALALSWERHRRILRSKATIFSSILLPPIIACLVEVNKIRYIYIESSSGKFGISQLQMERWCFMMLHISGLLHIQCSLCLQSQCCFGSQIISFILFSLQQCGSQMCFPVFRL